MSEQWKEVAGYENDYIVSTHGHVCSTKRGKVKPVRQATDGVSEYRRVTLNYHTCYVHRLVALAFIPNPDNKPIVGHRDNNPANNHVSNLVWMTQAENIKQMYTDNRNVNKASRVVAINSTSEIQFESVRVAAKALGILPSSIRNCLAGFSKTCAGYKWEYVQ